jgi:hypothetical protein
MRSREDEIEELVSLGNSMSKNKYCEGVKHDYKMQYN